MPDVNDMALTREYADRGSETAFAELVQRHINLVYSVALRYTGNSPDAQDVTQAVFIILAQKAASLRQRTALTGWLYETTRLYRPPGFADAQPATRPRTGGLHGIHLERFEHGKPLAATRPHFGGCDVAAE
ncbi:MAG TPA: sigma factor [Candidatus Aquilonibacter sp.]|nr:sigma factor [Candidatus Aquilonibacter sp.]